MSDHPIEGLMTTAMNSIQDMIDVNTIIGEPIETSNNIVIIPISKVAFGFAAGGSEFKGEALDEYKKQDKEEAIQYRLPFGGGSGAGVSINPIAFLVIQQNSVKLMPVNYSSSLDKFLDYIPDLVEKTNSMLNKCLKTKEDETNKIINKIEDNIKTHNQKNKKQDTKAEKEIKEDIKEIDRKVSNIQRETNELNRKDEMYEFEYDETSMDDD